MTETPQHLKSGRTFWQDTNYAPRSYSSLGEDISCDIVIVGSGIVGAMLAYYLSTEGISIIVVDKREIGAGSTSASTALLLYELDVHLLELVEKIGEEKAVRVYMLSLESLGTLRTLSEELGISARYKEKKSLYVAFEEKDLAEIKKEYTLRKKHGFSVSFLERTDLKRLFHIDAYGAILSEDAAEVDPYALTHALLEKAAERGVNIFAKTEIQDIHSEKHEHVLTSDRASIKAKHVVMATGYESADYIKKEIVALKSSYVIVSEPIKDLDKHWLGTHLVWETARPYIYVRTTADNRIIVGGADEEVVDDETRDSLIPQKSQKLVKKFQSIVPDISFQIAYAWAGTFGETEDGMGYIGVPQDWENTYFAVGFGGNGINFAVIAAEIIAHQCLQKECEIAELFSFER